MIGRPMGLLEWSAVILGFVVIPTILYLYKDRP